MDRPPSVGRVEQPGDVAEFSSPQFRRAKAIRFGLTIAILGWLLYSMAKGPRTSVVDVYLGIVAVGIGLLAIGFVRSFAAGIYLDKGGVVAKTTYSTKHWKWESLDRADSLDSISRNRASGYLGNSFSRGNERVRVVPVLYLTRGVENRLYGLKFVSTTPYDSEWVDDAITEINRRVELRRRGG
jgi:hypothetical protein